MLFGKICEPVEFMCKPYEDCLSAVVVTHSPRYLIDMNLKHGETIFDKLNVPYDELRKQPNPIKTILNYYRKQLKEGEDVWYLEQNSSKSTNLIIRVWTNLTASEKTDYMNKGFCLFPELFSDSSDKYSRFALWLSTREGVICPNVRDAFSAGGRGMIKVDGIYHDAPQIIMRLNNNIDKIKAILTTIELDELKEYWQIDIIENDRFSQWHDLIVNHTKAHVQNSFLLSKIIKNK